MRALSILIEIVTGIESAKSTAPAPLKVPPPGVWALSETRRSLLPLAFQHGGQLLQPRAVALVLVAASLIATLPGEDRLGDRAGRGKDSHRLFRRCDRPRPGWKALARPRSISPFAEAVKGAAGWKTGRKPVPDSAAIGTAAAKSNPPLLPKVALPFAFNCPATQLPVRSRSTSCSEAPDTPNPLPCSASSAWGAVFGPSSPERPVERAQQMQIRRRRFRQRSRKLLPRSKRPGCCRRQCPRRVIAVPPP